MSIKSTATALAEPDPTAGNDDEIANQICMLVPTCTNGTLLCPTSFHQEEAVTMCEGLGQKCPEGVLQLTEMEMVLTFWSDSEMMAATHWLAAATFWHGNPIVLQI